MNKKEVNYLESRDYMGIQGKGITNSTYIRTKSPNKKQKARFAITEITKHNLRKFCKKFKNSPYIGYKIKHIHNEPTEDYFLLIKNITKRIKNEIHVWLCNKGVKSGTNETIGNVNEEIGHFKNVIQS